MQLKNSRRSIWNGYGKAICFEYKRSNKKYLIRIGMHCIQWVHFREEGNDQKPFRSELPLLESKFANFPVHVFEFRGRVPAFDYLAT